MSQEKVGSRNLPMLDKIHILFLLYSGAHNTINAWSRASEGGGVIFFAFVLVGVLCVELMLYAVYHYWKEGRLFGSMQSLSLWAGAFAMFYATAGIIAQASGAVDYVDFHHHFILPTSAPVMFVFSFLIQSVDPITKADRDTAAQAHELETEGRREKIDQQRLALENRKNIRRLKAHVQYERMSKLWRETMSRRTKRILTTSARFKMPALLKSIGVPVDKAARVKRNWLGMIPNVLSLPEHAGDSGGKDGEIDHGNIDVTVRDLPGK